MRVGDSIYLDHQATTPIDPQVKLEMDPYLYDVFGNPHSSEHSFGWYASKAIDKARAGVAGLIGADPDEIIFTSGATESNNLALFGLMEFFNSARRRKLIVSQIEHKSIINIAKKLSNEYNVDCFYVKCDKYGLLDGEDIGQSLKDNSAAILSISSVNNEIGTIQNLIEITRLAKSHGTLVHVDASQAPCAIDIDVVKMDVDMLSLSSHKIYGPKGIGALYVRRDVQKLMKPMIIGGGQEHGLRGGTLPTHQCVGFGAAANVLKAHIASGERERLRKLKALFLAELSRAGINYSVNGPPENQRHPGNLNLCFHGCIAQDLLMATQPHVAASSGSACNSGVFEPSYVLKAIGLTEEDARASIRYSVGRYTTEKDVTCAVEYILRAYTSLNG
ncbi:cysteine desulfurase family protein [Geoalkalibacter halelectricus]|uniref:cysteine desulfurase family protein n=1 Tax=Geoalkalibacter halelectricus TaxID=2847045 RepID=UPI0026708745|nr:cysteine desulfurase family protein [Geoalkalibacter halelectricus]MDO3380527.1 cysteine desulfurase [Geoalkalibacter halelectricus]